MSETGEMAVRFPNIRWDRLRETEGWSALQYHSLLHTTFTVYPPSIINHKDKTPNLKIDLSGGSFFAVFPFGSASKDALEWYAGNEYEDHSAQSKAIINVPNVGNDLTCFHILISGDYEVCILLNTSLNLNLIRSRSVYLGTLKFTEIPILF